MSFEQDAKLIEEAKKKGYWLDNWTLKGLAWDETSGNLRESSLNLDYCVTVGSETDAHLHAAQAPKSLTNPTLDHLPSKKLSQMPEPNQVWIALSIRGDSNNILHCRRESWMPIIPNYVWDTDLNLDEYVRRSRSGHIEWIHPQFKGIYPEWVDAVFNIAAAMSKTPSGNAFEMAVDLAKDELTKGMSENIGQDAKEWMKDTYVDGDRLIRHGT